MHRVLLVLLVAVLSVGFSLSADEQETIKKRLHEFTESFNKANGTQIATLLSENASITLPITGETVRGKKEVVHFFELEFPALKGKKLLFIPKSVEMVSAEKAVVQGVSELVDNGKVVRQKARKVELVKQNGSNGSWFIDAIKEIEVELPPNQFLHLKELEWLVGNWEDRDDNVTIRYNVKWDKFKNFLLQHFKMTVYGVEVMEGQQIIGWDPVAKSFRSWVYDSDGGFGTGVWKKEGSSWHVKLNFVLGDGQQGTATNVYTPRDAKSFTFASIDRKIGKTKVPNLEPVQVLKEEP